MKPLNLRELAVEVFGYGLASAVALGVDIWTLRTLADIGLHYQLAAAVAFLAGATVAYLLSVRFVFRSHQLRNRGMEFFSFLALGLVGLLVNAAAMFVAISAAGLGLVTAKLLAAACTFATNFTLRRQFLFTPSRTA